MKTRRVIHSGGRVLVSPLVMECIRDIQREREPNARLMVLTEEWAATRLAYVVAEYRARRRRRPWAR
jgi:hypothetical protein